MYMYTTYTGPYILDQALWCHCEDVWLALEVWLTGTHKVVLGQKTFVLMSPNTAHSTFTHACTHIHMHTHTYTHTNTHTYTHAHAHAHTYTHTYTYTHTHTKHALQLSFPFLLRVFVSSPFLLTSQFTTCRRCSPTNSSTLVEISTGVARCMGKSLFLSVLHWLLCKQAHTHKRHQQQYVPALWQADHPPSPPWWGNLLQWSPYTVRWTSYSHTGSSVMSSQHCAVCAWT